MGKKIIIKKLIMRKNYLKKRKLNNFNYKECKIINKIIKTVKK